MEDIMPLLFWLPMIILSGIWTMAIDTGSRIETGPRQAARVGASTRRRSDLHRS
jgi:hypothetical protein